MSKNVELINRQDVVGRIKFHLVCWYAYMAYRIRKVGA